jgi:signal transduction histidine kinase
MGRDRSAAANRALLCKNGRMVKVMRTHRVAIMAWMVLSALGCLWIGHTALGQLRAAFETDARIVHRLLSQRAVQHDAILATLALLQSGAAAADRPEPRLTSVYPQILAAQRRDRDTRWEDPRFAAADAQSRSLKRAVMVDTDFARGRYWLMLAADTSYALQIDMRGLAPWSEWPMQPASSPVRVTLEIAGQRFVLQEGLSRSEGWRFDFSKHLASDSQPFDVVALRHVSWAELPWGWMLAWLAVVAVLLAALTTVQRQRAARRRAEELLRLGQVARLNTLGELAAGMAHEVNQPLAAILANTQAAGRLLADTPPDVEMARSAMTQAVQQAQRAAAVVGRLRRAVELPDRAAQARPVDLNAAVRDALYLLEPQLTKGAIEPAVRSAGVVSVLADPVAVEQIIHNLLLNAMQALELVPPAERVLALTITTSMDQGVLTVRDSGPGIAADVLPRLFEPFFTTRGGGLGLGLSLCETLAIGMNGTLRAANHAERGAEFTLTLPLAVRA